MILQDMTKATHAELAAQIEALRAENAKLKAARPQPGVSFKVTEKGGVSVYGLGRFPVTLYKSQWQKLIAAGDKLVAFLQENDARLATKD